MSIKQNTTPTTNWINDFWLGRANNKDIYLCEPRWSSNGFWNFGFINSTGQCSYHLSLINKNNDLYDNLKNYFDGGLNIVKKDLLIFCELMEACFLLKKMTDLYKNGGGLYVQNPCRSLLQDHQQFNKINFVLLPKLFDEIGEVLERNRF